MILRVGRIPFLVCAPFFHDFLGHEGDFSNIQFVDAPPSTHCRGLKEGAIHLSPASSITFAQMPDAFVLSPDICTSCSFEVRSVKLFATVPLEELDGEVIKMTTQSETSVALLKVLLEGRFSLRPTYVRGFYEAGDKACLLIGDQALEENERGRFPYSYDLGALWRDWHGLPFVFGAWIVSKRALKPDLESTLVWYLEKTKASIEKFRSAPQDALDRWLSHYPVKLSRKVIDDYYTTLDYRFTDERKKSLHLFYEYAKELGIVESAPELRFV